MKDPGASAIPVLASAAQGKKERVDIAVDPPEGDVTGQAGAWQAGAWQAGA
jgi:hypothetical protein